jgi:HlyD family secretion protein
MKISKINKKWIILVVIILIAGLGVSKLGKKKVPQVKKQIENVKVQAIKRQNISTEVQYASKLEAAQSVTVSPKSSGKVATVNVNVGDKVTAGQVLYTLDTSTLNASLEAQQASVNVAKASLNDSILKYQQTVDKAQITYNTAKDSYGKEQQLYEAGAVSKQELDNAKNAFDNASIDLKNAQDNLNLLKQSSTSTQVGASIAQSEAGVNSTIVQINDATVTSPITGVVSAKNVDAGEIASGTVGTVTIIDTSSLIAEVTVPDKVVGKLQVGQSVPVVVTAAGDSPITGVIDNISPDVSSTNNAYIVKVKLDNSNGNLKAGMFAKVSIPDQNKDNVLVVPNEAVKMETGVNYIYTVDGNKVKKIVVETGISTDKVTEITGNVKEGAGLITEGQNLLSDGDKVNIVK